MRLPGTSLLLSLSILILVATAGTAQAPLLQTGDVPGFHLHKVYQVRCELGGMREEWPWVEWSTHFPGLAETLVVSEDWRTVTKEEYKRYLSQHARPPSNASSIFIDREVLPNPSQAASFARLLVRGRKETTLPGIGLCWIDEKQIPGRRYAFSVVFSRSNTAVMIESGGPDWTRSRADALVRAVVTRLDQGNTALAIHAEVVSKHVKPPKNERAEVRLTSSAYPINYVIQVKRQGQVVYQAQAGSATRTSLVTKTTAPPRARRPTATSTDDEGLLKTAPANSPRGRGRPGGDSVWLTSPGEGLQVAFRCSR